MRNLFHLICIFCFVILVCQRGLSQDSQAVSPDHEVLIDTTFGNPKLALNEQKSEHIEGMLPAGWQDDSSAANLSVAYQILQDEGGKFQRIKVSHFIRGQAQIKHDLPDMNVVASDVIYKLKLSIRGSAEVPVQLGIRQAEDLYQFGWHTDIKLTPKWQNLNFAFELSGLKRAARPPIFFVAIRAPGHMDIDFIQLIAIPRKQFIADVEQAYSQQEPSNLFSNSRLPLGLTSGWWLDNKEDNWTSYDKQIAGQIDSETTVEADKSIIGPSGSPALHINAAHPFTLFSAPFSVPLSCRSHTASFYLRGQGRGSWLIYQDGKTLAHKDFDLSDGNVWRRQKLPFVPNLFGQVYAMKFEGAGSFWLDGFQVEAGDATRSYTTQMPCEVALSCNSPIRIQFSDEPAVVDFCVSGQAQVKVLKAKVINIYGEEKLLPEIKLGTQFLVYGHLDYSVFPKRPLGPFRIEAWAEDGKGKRISPFSEIVMNRLHRPHYWMKLAPNSPFGSHLLSNSHDILLAKAIGVNWARLHDAGTEYIGWYHLEPSLGQWSFRDAEIKRYHQYGLNLLGVLATTPGWASYMDKERHGYFDKYYEPRNLDAFSNYVRTVSSRYKGVIDAYEVWNEPWIPAWWSVAYDEKNLGDVFNGYRHSVTPQADYARLMQTAYKSAKLVDPQVTIVGFSSSTVKYTVQASNPQAGRIDGDEWTREVMRNGGLNACDVVSYHQYLERESGFPGYEVETGYHTAVGALSKNQAELSKPVWLTEGNVQLGFRKDAGFYHYTIPYLNADPLTLSGTQLCSYIITLLGSGISKVFVYSMHAHDYFGQPRGTSVLTTADDSLHPSGVAYAAMTWQLEDTKFVKRIALTDDRYAYLFQGSKNAVAVLLPLQSYRFKLPIIPAVSVRDLWGNPLEAGSTEEQGLMYVTVNGTTKDLEGILKKF